MLPFPISNSRKIPRAENENHCLEKKIPCLEKKILCLENGHFLGRKKIFMRRKGGPPAQKILFSAQAS